MRNQALTGILLAIVGFSLMVLGFAMGSAQEDDLFWNCYLNGNHTCGSVQPTTGFVNLEFWN